MTFRTRILLACIVVGLAPLLLLAAGVRREVQQRITLQYHDRVAASTVAVQAAMSRQAAAVDARLRSLARSIMDEPQQRAALLDAGERTALLDYATHAIRATGLDYLMLLDGDGTVLSSGHFRNDYGRVLPALATTLPREPTPALVAGRRPDGEFLALARAHAFELGGRSFVLAGGIEVDTAFVSTLRGGANGVILALEAPGAALSGGTRMRAGEEHVAEEVVLPFITAAGALDVRPAKWTIAHSLAPLHALLRRIDRWLIVALGAAALLALVTAQVLAARVTRPLEELARRAGRVEIGRYDVGLATRRRDEIGTLSRLLDRMVQRLRAGAQQLREAERRATVGDMARQVNHDIRNGLLPIRNVIAHLAEVARTAPAELGGVFAEREETLRGGIGYLENLATNYARLSPRVERLPCDIGAVLQSVVRESALAGDARVRVDVASAVPRVTADPVALRRVIENLALNALESLPDGTGRVLIHAAAAQTGADANAVITVSDTGAGMAPEVVERIFDDFYTTRERGTGLGLSIVRRLVADMGGRIAVRSEAGRGTTFTLELPAAQ